MSEHTERLYSDDVLTATNLSVVAAQAPVGLSPPQAY